MGTGMNMASMRHTAVSVAAVLSFQHQIDRQLHAPLHLDRLVAAPVPRESIRCPFRKNTHDKAKEKETTSIDHLYWAAKAMISKWRVRRVGMMTSSTNRHSCTCHQGQSPECASAPPLTER